MTTSTPKPPADWQASMRLELANLQATILRVGLLAAQMACSPEERARLQLCMREQALGSDSPSIREFDDEVRALTRYVAMHAQCIVSKAAAAPDDPRRQG